MVTGAANGLGRAIAQRLAEEGARVALGDIAHQGSQAFGVVGDVTEEAPAAKHVNDAVARYGRLDILVNNVGGSRAAKIWEMTVAHHSKETGDMTKTELMSKVRAAIDRRAEEIFGVGEDLLVDGASVGREVMAKAAPPMTRAAYLEFQRRISRREVYEAGR